MNGILYEEDRGCHLVTVVMGARRLLDAPPRLTWRRGRSRA